MERCLVGWSSVDDANIYDILLLVSYRERIVVVILIVMTKRTKIVNPNVLSRNIYVTNVHKLKKDIRFNAHGVLFNVINNVC